MSTPKVGDRVRVEFEGEVIEESEYGQSVKVAYNGVNVAWVGVSRCEVIAPPIKVGDIVTADNIGQLPPWSIVARRDEGLAIQRERNCVWMCRGVGIPKGDLIGWGDVEVLRIGGTS